MDDPADWFPCIILCTIVGLIVWAVTSNHYQEEAVKHGCAIEATEWEWIK